MPSFSPLLSSYWSACWLGSAARNLPRRSLAFHKKLAGEISGGVRLLDLQGRHPHVWPSAIFGGLELFPSSTLDSAHVFRGGQTSFGLAVSDLNRDGHPDFITANQDSDTASVFLNDGKGGFPNLLLNRCDSNHRPAFVRVRSSPQFCGRQTGICGHLK